MLGDVLPTAAGGQAATQIDDRWVPDTILVLDIIIAQLSLSLSVKYAFSPSAAGLSLL